MYIDIQKQINKIMIITSLTVMLLLGVGYYVMNLYHLSRSYLFFFFLVILILHYTFIRFLEKNLEYHQIYKMLHQGQIALAYVKKGKFYKESRDSRFQKQFIYEFDIEIITQDHQKMKTKIYENMIDGHLDCLPGHVYVTYNYKNNTIGIIPTLMLNMTPSVESIVRAYEDKYDLKYLAVMRKQGLILKRISEIIS